MKPESIYVCMVGGGTCLKSKGSYYWENVTIRADVVESDNPLLLSRIAMKRAAITMDLNNYGKRGSLEHDNFTTLINLKMIPVDTFPPGLNEM